MNQPRISCTLVLALYFIFLISGLHSQDLGSGELQSDRLDHLEDPETVENEEFEGASHWEKEDRDFCDNEELDTTWTWSGAVCLTYFYNFQIVKVEVISWEPALIIYRDFFDKKETDDFMEVIEQRTFEEQQVVDDDGREGFSKIRKANGTDIYYDDYPEIFETVNSRIPTINWGSRESIAALSYNPGGHYATHYDYLVHEYENETNGFMKEYGNRMATFIMVLNKAELGGATIFPRLGTAVRAEVGDAYLWFNMKGDGSQEDLSEHGGCPIYKGNKVIATIWIRMAYQQIMEEVEGPVSIPADFLIPELP